MAFNWEEYFLHGGEGYNPFDQQGFSYNAQNQAEAAAQSYDPSMGSFEDHINRSMPSTLGQMGQALGQDFMRMEGAQQFSQQQQAEGQGIMQDALSDYQASLQDMLGDFMSGMEGVESGTRDAMDVYNQATGSAIGDLMGEYNNLLDAGARTGDELRGYGQDMLDQAGGYYDEFEDRARRQERKMDRHVRQAESQFGVYASAMTGAMENSLNTVKRAADESWDNSLAIVTGQLSGLNENIASQKRALEMDPDMTPAQKASLSATLDRQGAQQAHAYGAQTAFAANATRTQNTMAIAAAEKGIADVNGFLANASTQLSTNLGGLMANTFQITNNLVSQGMQFAHDMTKSGYQMMAQGAMQEMSAQLEASGIMKHATDLKMMAADRTSQVDQWLSGTMAEAHKLLGGMEAAGAAAKLEGNFALADFTANMTVNPTSLASVMMSMLQVQMMGAEAGIDFSASTGLDWGSLVAGESPWQNFNVNLPGGTPGEIPSNFEMGFDPNQMTNLSQLGMMS